MSDTKNPIGIDIADILREARAKLKPHTPVRHVTHAGDIPCGCWTGTGSFVICINCGAAYDPAEVSEFVKWTCYDCGGGSSPPGYVFRSLDEAMRYLDRAIELAKQAEKGE